MEPINVRISAPVGTLMVLGTIEGWDSLGGGWFRVDCPDWRHDVKLAFGATFRTVAPATEPAAEIDE